MRSVTIEHRAAKATASRTFMVSPEVASCKDQRGKRGRSTSETRGETSGGGLKIAIRRLTEGEIGHSTIPRIAGPHYEEPLATGGAGDLRIVLNPLDNLRFRVLSRSALVPVVDLPEDGCDVGGHASDRTEVAVAEVAQAGQDELPLVQSSVDGAGIDGHVG